MSSWKKAGVEVTLSILLHRELKRGTLRILIRDSGLTVDEFVALPCMPGCCRYSAIQNAC
jgi:hypothetical protein